MTPTVLQKLAEAAARCAQSDRPRAAGDEARAAVKPRVRAARAQPAAQGASA